MRTVVRRFISSAFMALALCLLAAGARSGGAPVPRPVTFPMRTMGTYANVTVLTADSAATAPVARIAQACLARGGVLPPASTAATRR